MLCDAILVASRLFHELEPRAPFYDDYLNSKRTELWESPDALTLAEIERLILFLNQWASRYESSSAQQRRLLDAIRKVLPFVQAAQGSTLMGLDLKGPLRRDIARAFDTIASCGSRYEATAASKILHTIDPRLFVMWDRSIQLGYAVGDRGEEYAQRFLPRVQNLALRAVEEYLQSRRVSSEAALEALTQCGHTFAKVLDEYNYAKFTMRRDEVWDTELGP